MNELIKLTHQQRELAERHVPMVREIVRKYIRCNESILGLGFDDLCQEGCVALCKAAARYDPARGDFEPFAARVIRNCLIDYCRAVLSNHRNHPVVSLDELREERVRLEASESPMQNAAADEEQAISRLCVARLLETRKRSYRGAARLGVEALLLKTMDGCGVTDIARLYGCEPNLVGAWISKAKKKLLSDLTAQELGELGIEKVS